MAKSSGGTAGSSRSRARQEDPRPRHSGEPPERRCSVPSASKNRARHSGEPPKDYRSVPRICPAGVRPLWCMKPRGDHGRSPRRGGMHQRGLTPSDQHRQMSQALGRPGRSGSALHPTRDLYHPNLIAQTKTRAAEHGSSEGSSVGAAHLPCRGQTPLVHEAQRQSREKSNPRRNASKGSDPFGPASTRAASARQTRAIRLGTSPNPRSLPPEPDRADQDARGRACILRRIVSRCRASALPGLDPFGPAPADVASARQTRTIRLGASPNPRSGSSGRAPTRAKRQHPTLASERTLS